MFLISLTPLPLLPLAVSYLSDQSQYIFTGDIKYTVLQYKNVFSTTFLYKLKSFVWAAEGLYSD